MKYNSQQKKLPLPEYGRNIQNMVDHCRSIDDRRERNRCAGTLIRIMRDMFPEYSAEDNGRDDVYWDHLVVMADFDLDVDIPCNVIRREELESKPRRLEYQDNDIIYRHYGHIIQELTEKAIRMPEGPERETLKLQIATQMKRAYMTWNKPEVSDFTIFKDLYELSHGEIELTENMYSLGSPALDVCAPHPQPKKKKKK